MSLITETQMNAIRNLDKYAREKSESAARNVKHRVRNNLKKSETQLYKILQTEMAPEVKEKFITSRLMERLIYLHLQEDDFSKQVSKVQDIVDTCEASMNETADGENQPYVDMNVNFQPADKSEVRTGKKFAKELSTF
jgi:hypothetical protein